MTFLGFLSIVFLTLRFNPNSNRHILIKLNKSEDINDENDKLSNIQNESLNHYWTEINAL